MKVNELNSVEIATLFKLIPETHLPMIATGSRCFDQETKDSIIVLGFADLELLSDQHKTRLSMVQVKDACVVGLPCNKGV